MQNEENKTKKSFFKGMNSELKKVIWPTGKQTLKSTAITIGFVLLISVILIVFNVLFDFMSTAWYDLLTGNNKTQKNDAIITSSGDVSGDISGDLIDEINDDENNELENDNNEEVNAPEDDSVENIVE